MKKEFLWLAMGVLLLAACQLPFIPIQATETPVPAGPTIEPIPNKPEPTSGED